MYSLFTSVLFAIACFFMSGFFISVSAQIPGYVEGTGNYFQITDSTYRNVAVESSVPIWATIESIPEMITMSMSAENGEPMTTIILSGLLPDTKYYKYQDGYDHMVEFVTDDQGVYVYEQNIAEPHVVFIQPRKSTKFIRDNAAGGDCAVLGTWDVGTKTCVLMQDVYETIQIDNNGITLDGNNFTVTGGVTGSGIYVFGKTGVTIKNIKIQRFTDGISFFNTHNSVIENVTVNNNSVGLNIRSANNNIIKKNTIDRNNLGIHLGWYLSPNRSLNNQIYNNNFTNGLGSDFTLGPALGTIFAHPAPIGGNYWTKNDHPNEGCSDSNGDYFCDAPYVFYNPNGIDPLPWIFQNGWEQPIVPDEYFAKLSGGLSGGIPIHTDAGVSSQIIKTLPNDWIVQVFSEFVTPDGWVKISDPTDGSVGWISGGLDRVVYSAPDQNEFHEQSVTRLETKSARADSIKQAVHHYFTNSNTAPSLYSGNDTAGLSLLPEINFPEELVLAIASQESGGGFGLDNEIVSFDYGHGIMQITFQAWAYEPDNFSENKWDNRGIYSKTFIPVCKNLILNPSTGKYEVGSNEYKKCYKNTATKNTLTKPYDHYDHNPDNPVYKQYTNTHQSIYANIKDALGVLRQDKFRKKCPRANVIIAGYTFSCNDIEKIIMVWGYNGWTQDPGVNYLRAVANKLENISADFPGTNYANTDQFIEKMRIANDNRKTVWVQSPVELSMIDSTGNKTGISNGIIYEDIPNSAYFEQGENATVFFPEDTVTYRVQGTDTGTYGIIIESVEAGDSTVFRGIDLPITEQEIHTYTVDHDILANGGNGVTVAIDTEGDGVVDRTLTVGAQLQDITPPVITMGQLQQQYTLGEQIVVLASAVDHVDGAVPVYTTLNGVLVDHTMPITLSQPGNNTLMVTARDAVGNEVVQTVIFQVVYRFSGFMQPIQNDGSGIYKLKSTIPVKFSLLDAQGINPPPSVATFKIKKITNQILGDDQYTVTNVGADQGNTFRYDAQAKQYIFNLSTKPFSVGTWQLQALLSDGTTHSVNISLK